MIDIRKNVKISDFGVSKYLKDVAGVDPTQIDFVGTIQYSSPEMIKRTFLNEKQDIWSLGCILYELITLDPLFEGDNSLLISSKVVDGDTAELIKDKFKINEQGTSNNT